MSVNKENIREPFTNQKPRIATEADCKAKWSFGKPGEKFRCHICGHKFSVGDTWRWQSAYGRTIEVNGKKYGLLNFLVCSSCDSPGILDVWEKMNQELYQRFWWAVEP